MTTTHSITTSSAAKLTAVVQGYRARRSARALQNRIERELSGYRTAAEIQELDAIVERSGEQLDPMYSRAIERVRLRAA